MSTENALEDQLESALKTWIQDSGTHGYLFTGYVIRQEEEDGTDTITLPAIVIKVTRKSEEIGTGVWECDVAVELKIQADDTTDTARTQAWNDLIAVIYRDDLASKLTVASTIKTFGVVFDQSTDRMPRDRHHENRLNFTCWSCSV